MAGFRARVAQPELGALGHYAECPERAGVGEVRWRAILGAGVELCIQVILGERSGSARQPRADRVYWGKTFRPAGVNIRQMR